MNESTLKFKDVNLPKEIIRELIKLLELKQEDVKKCKITGIDEYLFGKIDGLNIAIRELEKFLKL